MPTEAIAGLHGVKGERPGEHRNRPGPEWEAFRRHIAANGIEHPVFITVDPGQEPKISEGSHRHDAAAELGMPNVPVESVSSVTPSVRAPSWTGCAGL
jgi:hypothetical protein